MERWKEEAEILEEEIRRTELFCAYFAKAWEQLSTPSANMPDRVPASQRSRFIKGRVAICLQMRDVYTRLISK